MKKTTIVDKAFLIILALSLATCSSPVPPTERDLGSISTPTTESVSPVEKVASPTTESPPQMEGEFADVVFMNGVVLTMELDPSQAQAIAIRGEQISAVGNDEEVSQWIGPNTRVIDLQGYTLMPGFVDGHNHLFSQSQFPDQGMWDVQDLALSFGVTTSAEAGVDAQLLDQILKVDQDGELRLRASLYLLHATSCGEDLGFWYQDHPPSRPEGAKLHISGIKVFTDGGSCNRPAVSFEYVGEGHGDLYFSQEELNQIVMDAQGRGYQVAIHALGDRAVEQSQNAIEAALDGSPNTPRHRIEHNALVRPDLVSRYTEIGVVAMIFGKFPACFFVGDTSKFKYLTPPEYISWEWPYRTLIDENPGLHFAWHSDYPVFSSINPMEHLYGMVTRKEVSEDGVTICEPLDWAIDDRLSVEEALRFMTIESAYSLFREEEVGSLKPGKYADMIVLSANPLSVTPDSLKGIQVWMTMVSGRVEYCSSEQQWICPPSGGGEED
ncbi:MAG TPA: amidohydrolase family protein [Anaerolineae bacterium]|nr:amidohydrolase family protein [Anaerolineae bacterium]